MRQKPEIIASTTIAQTRLFRIEQLDLRFANGVNVQYERLMGSPSGGVLIVPLLDAHTVLLIREYAAGMHRYELALPKGRIETGESLLDAANREIMEEIGYGAHQLDHIHSLTIAPGYVNHTTHIVLARNLYPQRSAGDEPEEIEVVPWRLEHLHELLGQAECTEARSIAALFIVRDLLQRKKYMTLDRIALLEEVINLAILAGEKILAVYGTDFRVHQKHDTSPVTEADRLADQTIVAGLKLLTPDIPSLSEEADAPPFSVRAPWKTLWLVDPLDGTREFVKRNGEFTVNIALVENSEPVLGVVYAPVGDICYYASRGHGAYKKVALGRPVAIHAKRYQPDTQMIVTGSRSHNTGDDLRHFLTQIGPHKYLPMGSALKSCLVAEGAADIYPRFGPTCEWDTAAAQCIVEEAGGRFTDMALQPLRYNLRDTLLNPHFLVFGDPDYDWRRLLK